MNVLIMGAGNIGRTIAKYLTDSGNFTVTVTDTNQDALNQIRFCETVLGERAPFKPDVLINALPHTENVSLISYASYMNCHYFDLSEDVASTTFAKEISESATPQVSAFMPQCGLAPGMINIMAYDLIKQFDDVQDVKMRVGALPLAPSNAFKYNFTWSVDGLINEYIQDCKSIENGSLKMVKGMEGLEHISLDGVDYEAFNTSGGAGSIVETMDSKAANVTYKTLRYPGHRDLMNVLLDDLKLKNDRNTLKSLMMNAIPFTENDVVIVYASVTGKINGKFVEKVKFEKFYPDYTNGLTAIQRTTATGLCIALDLFRQGKLPQTGFIRQEEISWNDFVTNEFYSNLQ